MEEDKEKEIKDFEEKYEKLKKKYDLPSYEDMNNYFEIEKIPEKDATYLLREIRRTMVERVTNYMKYVEILMNPSSGPFLFMALSKSLGEEENEIINHLFLELGKILVKSMELDNKSDEEKEAKEIKKIYNEWKEIQDKFDKLVSSFEKTWNKKKEIKAKDYIC